MRDVEIPSEDKINISLRGILQATARVMRFELRRAMPTKMVACKDNIQLGQVNKNKCDQYTRSLMYRVLALHAFLEQSEFAQYECKKVKIPSTTKTTLFQRFD